MSQVLRVSTFDKVPVSMIMQTGKYLLVFIFYVICCNVVFLDVFCIIINIIYYLFGCKSETGTGDT